MTKSEFTPNEPIPNDAQATLVGGKRNESATVLASAEGELAPLATDAEGRLILSDLSSITTSGGGGTEYTEDTPAAANPIGKALIAVRADVLAAITDVDGDNVAVRATNKGELYVKHFDAISVNPIVGQTGLTGGSGVVTAATLRAVLATDVALPAGDNSIGRVKLTDGTDVVDVFDLTNSNPLVTALVDANGDQITSFGSSTTQYIEGDVDASITGIAGMMEDAGNVLRPIQGSIANGQLVDVSRIQEMKAGEGVYTSTNRVMPAGFVTNEDLFGLNSGTSQRYGHAAVNTSGGQYTILDRRFQSSITNSLLKRVNGADGLIASEAGAFVCSNRQDVPTTDTAASGRFAALKSNANGAIWVDPASTEIDFVSGTLAAGGVTTAFATLVTNTAAGRILNVLNTLDKPIALSFDGTNDDFFMPIGSTFASVLNFDLAAAGRKASTNLRVRTIGANPTLGDVFASIGF